MTDLNLHKNDGEDYIIINPHSAAFRFGQGFFSTTLIYQGVPLWIDDHINRLNYSLKAFNLPPVDHIKMRTRAIKWAQLKQDEFNLMRLLVWPDKEHSSFYISGEKVPLKKKPFRLAIASFRRHSSEIIYQYKSFNYWQNLLAYEEANNKGCEDAIILNEKGEVCETSRCNI
ncbi:MAG: aminotransferase class IV, partial [Syntrophomonadaceae bacterium]|nr:aminotransferase class IV [Syntrophomonadaceae bacterium]